MQLSPRPTLQLGDMTLRFPWDSVSGRIGLEVFPTGSADKLVARRETLRGLPYIDSIPGSGDAPAWVIDSLAQVKIVGDPYPGAFAKGHRFRGSPSSDGFRFTSQTVFQEDDQMVILTGLENSKHHRIEHRILWRETDAAF